MKNEDRFEEVISRAKIALKVTGDKELADLLGLSPTAFSNRKMKGSIPYEKLTEVLASRNVDFRWVFTGSGETAALRDATMAATEVGLHYSPISRGLLQEMQEAAFAEKLTPEQLQERFRDRLPQAISVDADEAEHRADYFRMNDYQLVPRSSARASAGGRDMIIESDQIVDYLAFKREWLQSVLGINHSDLVLAEVRGDSMAPTLFDRDLVLVNLRENVLDVSAVFMIKVGGALLVKRVQHNFDGSVTVKSDNPRYDTETLSGEQLRNVQVVGRVVWPRLR
jgi:phage repressor protein C with HTH and peptisase S24 domain